MSTSSDTRAIRKDVRWVSLRFWIGPLKAVMMLENMPPAKLPSNTTRQSMAMMKVSWVNPNDSMKPSMPRMSKPFSNWPPAT